MSSVDLESAIGVIALFGSLSLYLCVVFILGRKKRRRLTSSPDSGDHLEARGEADSPTALRRPMLSFLPSFGAYPFHRSTSESSTVPLVGSSQDIDDPSIHDEPISSPQVALSPSPPPYPPQSPMLLHPVTPAPSYSEPLNPGSYRNTLMSHVTYETLPSYHTVTS
ncbi:hypothetical protein PM082_012364 [Marasmius tenuissimus]|nr:hypothetical protein PM082_012364 [Marasmius tenuissimus]